MVKQMKRKLSNQAIGRLRDSIAPAKPPVEITERLVMCADIDDGLIPLVQAALAELGDRRGAKSRLVNLALAFYLDATTPKAAAAHLEQNGVRYEPLGDLEPA